MIIARYLNREIFHTMVAVTAALVFIFLCNQFARYLDYVATGKYAANALFHLVLLEIPYLVGLLLPLGLFLGILLAYGRFYADFEMTVMSACGISRHQLLMFTMKFATIIFIIVSLLTLWAGPLIAKQRDKLMDIAEANVALQPMLPGRFHASNDGKSVFYVERINNNKNQMHNIFTAQQLHGSKATIKNSKPAWQVLSAKTGYQMVDKKTHEKFIVTKNGHRYRGTPGQKKFQIVQYGTYGVRIATPKFTRRHEGIEVTSTNQLFKNALSNKHTMAELQWRISMPLSVLILTLLAIPLSRTNVREGRFAQLLPAILIYMVYANMLFVSRSWLENGSISPWIGLWWIHIVMLLLGLWLFLNPAITLTFQLPRRIKP